MDANRLAITPERLENLECLYPEHPMVLDAAYTIRQQQAEIERLREDKRRLFEVYDAQYARSCEYAGQIERLNRAYEVLEAELTWFNHEHPSAGKALERAQRIKEGKDEQKSCTCAKSNWDSLDCPKHGLGVKEGQDSEQG